MQQFKPETSNWKDKKKKRLGKDSASNNSIN